MLYSTMLYNTKMFVFSLLYFSRALCKLANRFRHFLKQKYTVVEINDYLSIVTTVVGSSQVWRFYHYSMLIYVFDVEKRLVN